MNAPQPPGAGRADVLDLDAAWAVHPQVAVRPEPFGALLYHFGTRRLSLLTSRTVLDVVTSLATSPTARAACQAAGVSATPPSAVATALAALARTGMIVERRSR